MFDIDVIALETFLTGESSSSEFHIDVNFLLLYAFKIPNAKRSIVYLITLAASFISL